MTSRIPPLLSSYIKLPLRESLTLLTGVLNANANWLLIRYLYSVFSGTTATRGHGSSLATDTFVENETDEINDEKKVILVSWMREWEFWKSEARRAVGLDLAKLQQSRRIAFVDGLTSLFAESSQPATTNPQRPGTPPAPFANQPGTLGAKAGEYTLSNPTIEHLNSVVNNAIDYLRSGSPQTNNQPSILLVFDTPSIILQTSIPRITATSLLATIMALRNNSVVHSVIVSVPADAPLLALNDGFSGGSETGLTASLSSSMGPLVGQSSALRSSAAPGTPLEIENAAFVIALAHQSRLVLGCRMLGTGFAEDVSGVVRATRGGGYVVDRQRAGGAAAGVEDGEWLYYIGRDGSVKVWGRGGLDDV